MKRILQKLGSLSVTIWISAILMLLLIGSTVLESLYGTTFIQRHFYQTKGFDFFLSLLCINIICATIIRFPIKKRQIGFLITHIGIVGLLLGSLQTRLFGVEGRMMVFEGKSSSEMVVGGYKLRVDVPEEWEKSFDIRKGMQSFGLERVGVKFSANVLEHAVEKVVFDEGSEGSSQNYGLYVQIKSKKLEQDESFWLLEKHPADPHSSEKTIGAVKVYLKKRQDFVNVKEPRLRIVDVSGRDVTLVNLKDEEHPDVNILNTDLKIAGIRYFPFAKVSEGKIVNTPDSGSFNPAVEFELIDGKGVKERYLKFAYFPEFETIHEKASSHDFGVKIHFDAPSPGTYDPYAKTMLIFFVDEQGKWTYQINKKDGDSQEDVLIPGKWINTGWQDVEFNVEKILKKATLSTNIVEDVHSDEGVYAVELSVDTGKDKFSQWITDGQRIGFHAQDDDVYFELMSNKQQLPFEVFLKDFRKIEYPGTRSPAAFESDVTLKDEKDGVQYDQKISMNKPLDYKGFRVFQSSYIQDQSRGEASIFTVAKNPGIVLIYLSSVIMFIGAMMQFYAKGFSREI